MRKSSIEWAVISVGFRGAITVHRGGLGSRHEAQTWLNALLITQEREDHERFVMTSGMITRDPMKVAWRRLPDWQTGNPEEETE